MSEFKVQELDGLVLESVIRQGGKDARIALEELSGRAFGGNIPSRELVLKLENEQSIKK